jgi:type V secretory pathway adhesin AidA
MLNGTGTWLQTASARQIVSPTNRHEVDGVYLSPGGFSMLHGLLPASHGLSTLQVQPTTTGSYTPASFPADAVVPSALFQLRFEVAADAEIRVAFMLQPAEHATEGRAYEIVLTDQESSIRLGAGPAARIVATSEGHHLSSSSSFWIALQRQRLSVGTGANCGECEFMAADVELLEGAERQKLSVGFTTTGKEAYVRVKS